MIDRLRFIFELTRAHTIARRYFVTNGFDGALTMLGITMGFYSSGDVALPVVINACVGAAVALAMSGFASAYVSEAAEREKELRELEQALGGNLDGAVHGRAARLIPVFIAGVNGFSPLLIALLIILPLWLSQAGWILPLPPLQSAIGVAFLMLFLLGAFLGTVSGRFWLWTGLRTLLIALLTAGFILVLGG